MTHPQIIQVPGVGQEVAQGLAPLIQVLQNRQELAQRQAEAQQRADQAQKDMIANMFAIGLRTPGFESTDEAKTMEQQLGIPGLGQAIAQARNQSQREAMARVDAYVESLPDNPRLRAGIRASMAGAAVGATAEIQNATFKAFAPDLPLDELERARLAEMRANTRRIERDLARMPKEPTQADQQHAYKILGFPADQYVEGLDYVGILQDQLKKKDDDPRRIILNTAIQVMAQDRDLLGNPRKTPTQALAIATEWYRNIYPESSLPAGLTGQAEAELSATREALRTAQGIVSGGMKATLPDSTGTLHVKKYKDWAAVRADLRAAIKQGYPQLDDGTINTILDATQRQVSP
jgi:hypothetical protein